MDQGIISTHLNRHVCTNPALLQRHPLILLCVQTQHLLLEKLLISLLCCLEGHHNPSGKAALLSLQG